VLGAGVLFVVLALLGAVAAGYVWWALGNFDRTDVNVDQAGAGEPRNYLVVGSDFRADGSVEGRRSDTIMVVRLDPAETQASVLSFPRDLVVTIAGTGEEDRINSAYGRGGSVEEGRQRLIDTIRQNFSIEIHHYIEVDFAGFQQLVDAIGGVRIWVDRAIKDDGSGLFVPDRGCVTLDGQQALNFARSRELQYMEEDGTWSRPDPFADLGRIDRQQVFIRRAVARAIDAARSNPLRLRDIINIGSGSVTIDEGTDPIALFEEFRGFDLANLRTYALPVQTYDERATVDLNRAEAGPILNVFRNYDPGDMAPGDITVRALNTTATAGLAADAAAAFEAVGFEISEPDDLPEPHPRTTVYHLPGEDDLAMRVARHITGGAEIAVREDLDLQTGEVAVALGEDFTNIHMQPTPVDQMPTTTVAGGAAPPAPGASDAAGGAAGGAAGSTAAPPAGSDSAAASPGSGSAGPSSPSTTVPPPDPVTATDGEFVIGDPPPGRDCA
jgi:LCP family protein required for cell wall assembly